MNVSNNKEKNKHIVIGNQNTETVNHFHYPGCIVTCNSIKMEINYKITMGNRCYYGLQNLLEKILNARHTTIGKSV
jgi:hypothetical protein